MSAFINLYGQGTRVWIPDGQTVWRAAAVSRDYDGGPTLAVELEETLERSELSVRHESAFPPLRNPDILIGENDLTSLSHLHEPAVLHNLSVRFMQNQSIYTYCGIVLVAINPYEQLHIYGADTIGMYRGKSMGDLDPHIYAVSEEAFTKMERDATNQSIIVSGESGAGKTVSAKYAMRYFATVGGASQTETQVEKKVLASSPIMEAIGNAKTTRNDNSSRFGKYIEIDFNKHFHIIGANMRTYLLEKSRVVFQATEERNYHIFYQMCAGRHEEALAGCSLDEATAFYYLNLGEAPEIDGVDDLKEFNATLEAFKLLGFSASDQTRILHILAGVLHLGNVEIESGSGRGDSETSTIEPSDPNLKAMSELFEIEEEHIRKWLCFRKIVTGRETYTKPMNAQAALFARDALAKCIYAYLFDWIVNQINKALRTTGKVNKFIGVLDIYGFETFETNSFEQFCINYANEKLQQQFNLHVFKLEQEEYLKEGIDWKMIDFYDNQPCIDLIESKLGVLDLLDEECKMPKGSDKSWVEKLYDKCKKWEHFSKPRLNNTAFIVKHFADMVEYESAGFLDKNRDTVMEEQTNILRASRNDLLSDLFMDKSDAGSKSGSRGGKVPPGPTTSSGKRQNKKTVGSQFRDSLNLLMTTLNATTPHYVRCIKPNDEKAAFQFDPKRAVQQLRACGVLETVRISAAGYPSRWTYYDFFLRYRVLCHSRDIKKNDNRTTCENIVAKLIQDEDKYRFGKTKLFFRAGQVAYMEKLRSKKLRDCGIMIQKHVKGWLYRKKYRTTQASTLTLQRWVRGFLARRRTRHMRRTKAAITIQTCTRGWLQRMQYQKIQRSAVLLQARARGLLARKRHTELVRNTKAVIMQRHVRGWLQRKRYQSELKKIVLVQCQIRRFMAKSKLKTLKIAARSIEHQKKLNEGLENKIISLQQKLTQSQQQNKAFKGLKTDLEASQKELETLRKTSQDGKAAIKNVAQLEEELAAVKIELQKEREEKIDIVTTSEKELSTFKSLVSDNETEIVELKAELTQVQDQLAIQGQVDADEMMKKFSEEKANIHQEYEQERIAYQKLLKDYNRLEAQFENLHDEVHQNRAGSNMSFVSSSFTSDLPGEEESAYGSQSGRSSMRSSGVPDRGRLDQVEWDKGVESDVALTVKLQQKLKEAQRDKEKLEKRLEDLENSEAATANEKQAGDRIRLQELEVENSKLLGDLKRLRESLVNDTGDNDQYKEIMEQFEHLQDELDRRREECIQLRTVLATASLDEQPFSLLSRSSELPDTEELFTAYETQKKVIGQLQEQLSDEKSRASEIEVELKSELDKVMKTSHEQQMVINNTINRDPANNTEACLQHEITRLTGENFDLREKIETLNDTIKRLKRQLKTYMKKLTDLGATISDLNVADGDEDSFATQQRSPLESNLPVIRKKEHDYLGLFEYKKENEQLILKALIYDLKPKLAVQMLPGLPAYILFMMIRYTDFINKEEFVRSLIQGAIAVMKKVVKRRGMNDVEMKTLWLSNILRLLHNLKQYSGESQFQNDSSPKQAEQCLRNFDLSEYRRVLSDVAIWIYQGMTKLMEEEIQPILVPAVLEHEGIGKFGMAGPRPRAGSRGNELESPAHIDPQDAFDKLLMLLTRFHGILTKHGLDPEIIAQIFKQVFYFICSGSLNNLLLRKDLCHWSKGMQIRYNLAQLEQWARDQKVLDDQTKAPDALAPIIQASQLLQARKTDEDVVIICDMCSALKVCQITKILNLYTPADEYEEKVTPSFVRKIQAKLQDRALQESQQQATLLMDTKFSFAVRFPFNPSRIQLEELEIPESYNNLHNLLKKV
eukprot:maker-scaffold566_size135349-snap-gene-0.26 protein:Tk08891 transcript:maker-scaffold566_size135349-snap-gene-0.26-mRNA-1 annotation:"myosin va"